VNNSPIRVSLEDDMSTTEALKVMLVEDHLAFRQALTFLLSDDPKLEVVAQAGSLAEAREALDGEGFRGRLDVAVWAEEAEEVRRAGADAVLDKVRSYMTIADEVRRLGGG
jgi:chemotaxis response regulator CheB